MVASPGFTPKALSFLSEVVRFEIKRFGPDIGQGVLQDILQAIGDAYQSGVFEIYPDMLELRLYELFVEHGNITDAIIAHVVLILLRVMAALHIHQLKLTGWEIVEKNLNLTPAQSQELFNLVIDKLLTAVDEIERRFSREYKTGIIVYSYVVSDVLPYWRAWEDANITYE